MLAPPPPSRSLCLHLWWGCHLSASFPNRKCISHLRFRTHNNPYVCSQLVCKIIKSILDLVVMEVWQVNFVQWVMFTILLFKSSIFFIFGVIHEATFGNFGTSYASQLWSSVPFTYILLSFSCLSSFTVISVKWKYILITYWVFSHIGHSGTNTVVSPYMALICVCSIAVRWPQIWI